MVDRRRNQLEDKLYQAEVRKESELKKVVEKARSENQKFEETNWLMKMTKENQ